MTKPRRTLVDPSSTPYYHCIGRCVRRAFLCGVDRFSGQDYSHRKQWVVDRLAELTRAFTLEVCAYAVMSNHYHLVLRLHPKRTERLSDAQVMDRWSALFGLPPLVERYRRSELRTKAEHRVAAIAVAELRRRLGDLSWFMRGLNEYIARRANAEDGCTGRFWEGRFKSQALLDEAALVTCMSYVDLNPVRAAIARTPEESDFTSVQARFQASQGARLSPVLLAKMRNAESCEPERDVLPVGLPDYLALLDWAGRAIVHGKRGHIDAAVPPILSRLGIDAEAYLSHHRGHGRGFRLAIGRAESLRQAAVAFGQRHLHGIATACRLFPTQRDPSAA